MASWRRWLYPDVPSDISKELLQNERKLVIVGVIGKSAELDANKTLLLNVSNSSIANDKQPKDGQIEFFYNPDESLLLLHFQTTFDNICLEQIIEKEINEGIFKDFTTFSENVRNNFARMLLFATHVCHIIVFVELSVAFDASLLTTFKCLKIIRDKYVLKFLPKLIKNATNGFTIGKTMRLSSPRMLFLFENFPKGFEKTNEFISKIEFEMEDNIYKMLRTEFIIMNDSNRSLFSIPSNKRFVFFNTNEYLHKDPLVESVNELNLFLENKIDDETVSDDLRPSKDFGRCYVNTGDEEEFSFMYKKKITDDTERRNTFMELLKDHIHEALTVGFDDSSSRYRGKTRFVLLPYKQWINWFSTLHRIFIINPNISDFDTNDADYRNFLENFEKILCIDEEFLKTCCEIACEKAYKMYNNPTLSHYNEQTHKKMLNEALNLYENYACGPLFNDLEKKLRDMCEQCWLSGKQQCEFMSLRGNACILPKHNAKHLSEHSSGNVFISTCNCGRSQGHRDDPYTIRQANYDFYEFMAQNCNLCKKSKKIKFSIFEPSINDYRAAELGMAKLKIDERTSESPPHKDDTTIHSQNDFADEQLSQPLLTALLNDENDIDFTLKFLADSKENSTASSENNSNKSGNSTTNNSQIDELVVHLSESSIDEHAIITRQASTTEYLAGMVHIETPIGFLPQFPSWSLVCVGQSAVYSHNTGLQEHFQSGFLSGTNFLLPWDAHVRFEHTNLSALEKTKYRKMGEVFILKVFVGFDYECARGHRFMMNSPDTVLKSANGISRDSGSKVVFNNMPLYFPCPCRAQNSIVAQLMRIHVVTPKAPVTVFVDPKVRAGPDNYTFTMGLSSPPKLTQSAYWILRLPYVYQGDDTPIIPPFESVTSLNAINFGCLLAGMFGVSETEREN